MYKLLIVDDEPTEVRFIRYIINEYKLPFYVCAEGENGEEAVELATKHEPDFVIMDISMPIMDGLEAAAVIKKKYPATVIYIVTAYEYFEYAQKAIRIDVEDYLVKPLSPEQLVKVLKAGIAKVLSGRLKSAKEQKEFLHEMQNKTAVRRQLINYLLAGVSSGAKSTGYRKLFDKEKFNPKTILAASLVDDKGQTVNGGSLPEILANKINDKYGNDWFTVLEGGSIVVFSNLSVEKMNKTMGASFDLWYAENQVRISGGVSSILNYEEISNSYRSVERIRKNTLFWGKQGVFNSDSFNNSNYNMPDMVLLQKELFNSLLAKDTKSAISILQRLLDDMRKGQCSSEYVQKYFAELVTLILSDMAELLTSAEIAILKEKVEKHIKDVETALDLKNNFNMLISEFENKIVSFGTSAAEHAVIRAVEFIKLNCNQDISLEGVAEQFFLSPSYFSRIFKKHTGEGFASYLTKVRMEKAHKLLLTDKYTVQEVARMVGYNDPSYFSNVFKKHLDISPSQVSSAIHDKNLRIQDKKVRR
ncbi:MAG: response regulator [Bacillota bacterium]|nr:response regulator [Bacillota bacterium]